MSVIDNTPTNCNFLSPLNFKFTIKKAPHVNFFIQKVNIPSISMPPPEPNNPFVKTPIPGEHLLYNELNIKFKVDEDLNNYLEIHNWIRDLGKPENFDQYKRIYSEPQYSGKGIYSDISLMTLRSTKHSNYEIVFVDAFPIHISDVIFNTTDESVNFIEAEASFRYTYYTISKI